MNAEAALQKSPLFRLCAVLWLAAMAGVVAMAGATVPRLVESASPPVPLPLALIASVAQSGILLALATWAGAAMSRPLGLRAPVLEAALAGAPAAPRLKPQLVPAAAAGLAAGLLLLALKAATPAPLQALGDTLRIPAAARLLYGGITEEVLMRWGAMTLLAWLPWRLIQRRAGEPRRAWFVAAIVLSAALFAAGHLPALTALGAPLTPRVVGYVLIANTLPGLLFGLLYWRRGLESAIIAHALAHLVAFATGAA